MPKTDNWWPKLTKIDDPIADAKLPYRARNGRWSSHRVIIGRPEPTIDRKAYFCPIQMPGCFEGVKPIFGIGPVDSLMNAMAFARPYVDYLGGQIDFLPEHYEQPTLHRWRWKRLPEREPLPPRRRSSASRRCRDKIK